MTMVMVSLRAEASSEASRVADARTHTRDEDDDALAQLEADGPWIVIARRTRMRRLGRRVLLLWRVAYEDASGRVAESCLTAIAIQLRASPTRLTRAWIGAVLRAIDSDVRAQVEADTRGWRDAASSTVQSFSATRLARERAIAAPTRATALDAFQPGLFDRRAERLRQLHAGAVADDDRDATARLAALERSSAIVPQPARLLLVVVPPC